MKISAVIDKIRVAFIIVLKCVLNQKGYIFINSWNKILTSNFCILSNVKKYFFISLKKREFYETGKTIIER